MNYVKSSLWKPVAHVKTQERNYSLSLIIQTKGTFDKKYIHDKRYIINIYIGRYELYDDLNYISNWYKFWILLQYGNILFHFNNIFSVF